MEGVYIRWIRPGYINFELETRFCGIANIINWIMIKMLFELETRFYLCLREYKFDDLKPNLLIFQNIKKALLISFIGKEY